MAKAKRTKEQSQEALKALRDRLKRPAAPRVGDIARHFVEIMGGQRQFAQMMANEYNDAPAGGSTRKSILQLISYAVKEGQDAFDMDVVEDMDEDEMLKVLNVLLTQAGAINDVDEPATGPAGDATAKKPKGRGHEPRGDGGVGEATQPVQGETPAEEARTEHADADESDGGVRGDEHASPARRSESDTAS